MSDPQVWTLIGVFATSMFAALSLVVVLVNRATRGVIDGLRGELSGELGGLRGELSGELGGLRGELAGLRSAVESGFEAVEARLEAADAKVDARFETVNVKLDHLDRDVAALMKREFGLPD